MEMQGVKEKNSVKFMRKIWAVNTDLGIINNIPYTSEAREQMRSLTVNNRKKEDSEKTLGDIDI